jgi:hypothetical protein
VLFRSGVPEAAVVPPDCQQSGPIPRCLIFHDGGSHQNLIDSKPI